MSNNTLSNIPFLIDAGRSPSLVLVGRISPTKNTRQLLLKKIIYQPRNTNWAYGLVRGIDSDDACLSRGKDGYIFVSQ